MIDAEIVDDPNTNTNTDGRTPQMRELTSGLSGGDGEGYASTISALEQIKALLQQVSEVVNDLGDTLTAHTGLTVVEQTLTHAQAAHEPIAAAIAAAGGSDKVAETRWYDDL
ncbi:hypothetical protein DZF91_04385 [Actinomadura logoneensis]|uniref:Uncharacterized protein n=1 Tax=Actinomadura logoneensis TaxID=2293572 RepID=A0A372JSV1_9ACTN|nr:hypothetical protein [Actinomadura logoneensis]RFU42844.1 hypothetical protein DZF91_04385 [Actinomadura logoneensis]